MGLLSFMHFFFFFPHEPAVSFSFYIQYLFQDIGLVQLLLLNSVLDIPSSVLFIFHLRLFNSYICKTM